jgi:outer membrane protein TolC
VRLDIAWKEWLVAQQARAAAFDVLALEAQLKAARQASEQLTENVNVVSRAVDRHDKTLVDLAAADATAQDAQAAAITQARDLAHQRLTLNRAMGLPAGRTLRLRGGDDVPTRLQPPPLADLLRELESHRLDLLALKRGYESQDETLRAAILAQFPKVSLGFNAARDTSNVKTIGLGVTIDIPIFDRNQGAIANETATRQKLFDEYAARLFEARSDIATAIADIEGTNEQIAAAESALPKLERLAAIYEAELKQGNVDILSSYAARTAVWQKRIDVLKLRQQLMQNRIALEIAAGQILPMQASTAPTTRESK